MSDRHRKALLKLLPPGRAFVRGISFTVSKVFHALGDSFKTLTDSVISVRDEADPFTAVDGLEDWERVLRLPGPCGGIGGTLAERRNDIIAKLNLSQTTTLSFYEEYITALGFTPTIHEYRDFTAGFSRAGDPLTNDVWKNTIGIEIAETASFQYFRAGQGPGPAPDYESELGVAGDPVRDWGFPALECKIRQVKQAHVEVLFIYPNVS